MISRNDELLENARWSIISFMKAITRGNLTQRHYEYWRESNGDPSRYMPADRISSMFKGGWSKAINYGTLVLANLERNNCVVSVQKAYKALGKIPSQSSYDKWYKKAVIGDKDIFSSSDILLIEGSWDAVITKAEVHIEEEKRLQIEAETRLPLDEETRLKIEEQEWLKAQEEKWLQIEQEKEIKSIAGKPKPAKRVAKSKSEKEISLLIKQIRYLSKRINRKPSIPEWNTYATVHEFQQVNKRSVSTELQSWIDTSSNKDFDFSVKFYKPDAIMCIRRCQVARPFTHLPLLHHYAAYFRWKERQSFPTPSLTDIDLLFGNWRNALVQAGLWY
ncbi:hypothetical protein SD71_04515 [Cohnella kolymensis]|uniref:Primase C-terminal 2 domain-containing protein n=1 Tax=Cohnella kolymensis TaxID=1590652 RepID=A0ABR5A7G3_9BACL|nr:hypothetical protein [Cohnella kolymensis]KIL36969.1 hypothetical protein SD71_04515 [Cohnella kolymensis]